MSYEAIHAAAVAVPNVPLASAAYERLGLHLRQGRARLDQATVTVGQGGRSFSVHLLATLGARHPLAGPLAAALAVRRALFAIALRVTDLDPLCRRLADQGISAAAQTVEGARLAWLALHDRAAADLWLVEPPGEAIPPVPPHSFPLKRLDHVATIADDLEPKTRFWEDVLRVPVAGEVVTPAMVIRQLRIGDAVLELLGPTSADSPIRQRPPGLVSMASWEVIDLDAAVGQARAAGFSVPDPTPGPLPGTRIATIAGAQLAGVNMQLLQYV
jgi:catechol 2,3-dioxygenase-like lactoylglutathione lyase family enzyme